MMVEPTLQSFRDYPHRHLARVTIQLVTPLHVGSGREWRESDAGVVCDANGLPTIPGTSIAGVLRHAHDQAFGDKIVERSLKVRQGGDWSREPEPCEVKLTESLFGVAATKARQGTGSRLVFSWAKIHDSKNQVVDRLVESFDGDPVLLRATNPALRDHVRLNGRGAAADRGKFDELAVQRGHRFTFEIEFTARERRDDDDDDPEEWEALLTLLWSPLVRFGGKTRRGFGAFEVTTCLRRSFDLRNKKDFAAFCQHDPSLENLSERESWQDWAPPEERVKPQATSTSYRLQLLPRQFFMIGGGFDETTDADSAPLTDHEVVWRVGKNGSEVGEVKQRLVVPATSVKGALRHRTLFHLYALCGHYVDAPDEAGLLRARRAEAALFGVVAADATERTGGKSVGHVWIDDIYLPMPEDPDQDSKHRLQHHVHIDPFTGGASDGHLFNDLPLARGSLPRDGLSVRVIVTGMPEDNDEDRTLARKALRMALDDLCDGRLPLGAHGGRGYGFMHGEVTETPALTVTP